MADGTTHTQHAAVPDRTLIRSHFEMLHGLAEHSGVKGLLVIASFGEDPTTGKKIRSRVEHFGIGIPTVAGRPTVVDDMVEATVGLSRQPHRNCYAPWSILRMTLGKGERGKTEDVLAVLALAADQDADPGKAGITKLPMAPPYMVCSSAGNMQPVFPLARALAVAEAQPIADALAAFVGGDGGSKDLDHVWRIPGTLNWPTRSKIGRGRPLAPQLVTVAVPWSGDLVDADALAAACGGAKPRASRSANANGAGNGPTIDTGELGLKAENVFALAAALRDIPNTGTCGWEEWNRLGMALWAATDGSDMGRTLLVEWSLRSPNPLHVGDGPALERWAHYADSPPTRIGAGTIFHMANEARRAAAGEDEESGEGGEASGGESEHGEPQQAAASVADIFAELPPPRFDPSSMPQEIADFAESKFLATGADRAGFALAAVIACSAAIHPKGRLVLTAGDANRWAVPPALWGLAVGEPSAAKDAVLKAAMEPARVRFEILHRAWLVKRARLADRLKAEGKSEKDVAKALADRMPAPPMTETGDCTVEALQEKLAQPVQDGHGILVHAAEASSFLLRMESPGQQGARGAWLQFYDCVSNYSRMRVSTGNTTVPVWGGSIFLGIQPTVFEKLNAAMSLESDGMIQRMIPVLMARKQLRQPGQANEAAAALVARRCAMIYERGPIECHLSAAAAETYRAFEVDLDRMIATDPVSPAFGSWLGKLFGMWGRLALTFHHLAAPGAAPAVDNAVAEQTTRFIWDFAFQHAHRFYDKIGGGAEMEDTGAIGDWLLRRQHEAGGGEIELDLREFLSGPRVTRKIGADATRKKLDLLVSGGWLVERFPDPKAPRWRSTHWAMPGGISRRFEARREAYMRSLAALRDTLHG